MIKREFRTCLIIPFHETTPETALPLSREQQIARLAAENRLLQAADLGMPPEALAHAAHQGILYPVIRGVYLGATHPHHPMLELAAWTLRHPDAVGGMLTAAVYHDLTNAFARGTWLFIPRGKSPPRSRLTPLHVIQTSGRWILPQFDALNGIDHMQVHGVQVRLTDRIRTTLDLWRYPRRVSAEHALDALRRVAHEPGFRVAGFARLARRLDIWTRVEPVLQGVLLR